MPLPSSAERSATRAEVFFSAHARLIERLHAKSKAGRWGLTRERFGEALQRSVESRFRGAGPIAAEVDAYLQSLHAEDLALACACREGNEHAWEHFLTNYRQDLYAAARAIVGGGGEARARELADSLYAELYGLEQSEGSRRSLFDYFHGRSKLSTWLRAVLAQRHVDALRAGRRTDSLDDDREEAFGRAALRASPSPADPDRARLVTLLQEALVEALRALEPRDRLRLAYYYVHECTLAEIGRILGEHEATVSRHLERTRRALRKSVERTLRAGSRADGSQEARPGLSEAQIRLCFEYAVEKWPFDLTGALGAPDTSAGHKPSREASASKLGSERET